MCPPATCLFPSSLQKKIRVKHCRQLSMLLLTGEGGGGGGGGVAGGVALVAGAGATHAAEARVCHLQRALVRAVLLDGSKVLVTAVTDI